MNVLCDLTYLSPVSVSGVAIYTYRLLRGFIELNKKDDFTLLLTPSSQEKFSKEFPDFKQIIFQPKEIRQIPHLGGVLNLKAFNKVIETNCYDLLFSPFVSHSGLYSKSIPSVGVFHDAHGYDLKTGLKGYIFRQASTRILEFFTHIVTISNYAKSDIIAKIPELTGKTSVIYNSISFNVCKHPDQRPATPYILNVNTLEPYKNLITLVKAFNLLKDDIPHTMVVKAKILPYWDTVILPYIKANRLDGRLKLIEDSISEQDMDYLYYNADLFVSPSLKEGFGYTPIEAALHEIPVICSKDTALYETTMGLLNYYEPTMDEYALKEAILHVLGNTSKVKLQHISSVYKSTYSVKVQAQIFCDLFDSVIKNSHL